MFKKHLFTFIVIALSTAIYAQQPKKPTSGEIYKSIEKLNFLGNALFVAAHPDDENTRLISYLVNELNAHTTYLSITRGDGGQNLIGPEIQELLGVIRTQELLQARKVDGGNQMFSRANDFGYSKNAEETISIWDNELVKSDVVWAIRNTRPDVIINRFDHRTSGSTHGHHTASAMLSHELYEKAASKDAYKDQLQYVSPWQANRLFFNLSWWFFGSQEAFKKADKSNFVSFDIGGFYPLLGKSNTEIAALSRSNHRCQGFGSTGTRGGQLEYLELLKGDMPPSKSNVFEGINTTWTRVKGGDKIKMILDKVQSDYDFKAPNKSVPQLVNALGLIEKIEDEFWKDRKSGEIKNIISQCLGLYYDAIAGSHTSTAGEKIKIDIEAVKRLAGNVILKGIKILPDGKDTTFSFQLNDNETYLQSYSYQIGQNEALTNAYWLNEYGSKGMYKVSKPEWIGKPETPRNIRVQFVFNIEGKDIVFEKAVSYKYNDDEKGEVYRPFEITPEVFVNFGEKVYVFGDKNQRKIKVVVKAGAPNQKGQVSLPVPTGWKVSPSSYPFEIKDKNASQEFLFDIIPPIQESEALLIPIANANGKQYSREQIEINYDHIPFQMVFQPAETKLVKINIEKLGNNIAYIPGAGDEVGQSLRQIGYNVTEIEAKEISKDKIEKYDAIVMGVRAFNTKDDLKFKQEDLFNYVKNGGNLIVQYNTSGEILVKSLGPYPIKIGRDRVTVEEAPIRILKPDSPIMNVPNKITEADFKGWIQERGLYFASEWDKNYEAILSSNDPKEDAKDGGLLVAKYGEGYFIYTGYSWFRQLPAGVPGAFRIFANMVSLGNDVKP
jgi:LmbE family N-acetylglucosaminyl deacetylase